MNRVALIFLALSGVGFVFAQAQAQDDAAVCAQRNGDQSIAACTRIINSRQGNAGDIALAYTRRGDTYLAKGDFDRALADYNEALALYPNDPAAHTNRAAAYLAKGEYEKALADYRRALAINPKYQTALVGVQNVEEKLRQRSGSPAAAQPIEVISMGWSGCVRSAGGTGANATIRIKDWHALKDDSAVQQLLDKSREEGMRRCPTDDSVGLKILQKGITGALIEGRWLRATNKWKTNSRIAKLAKQEAQHAAAEPAPKPQQEQEPFKPQQIAGGKNALRDRFIAEFKVDTWANQQALQANVFMYKDKVVGVRTNFEQMVSPTEARFGQMLVTDVPVSEFTTPGQTVVLAMRILGLKATKLQGVEVSVPHGSLVGAYKCKQQNCSEFFD